MIQPNTQLLREIKELLARYEITEDDVTAACGVVKEALQDQEALRFIIEDGRYRPADRFAALCAWMTAERSEYFRGMPYQVFLASRYWQIIRKHKIILAGRACQLCKLPRALEVHHRSYKWHGYEHEHMSDLVVLCCNCHRKFHNRLAKPPS